MKITVVIERDEMGYYVAEIPAFPGCVSQGRTLSEVKNNIREAMEGWLEVMNDKARKQKAEKKLELVLA